MRKELVEEVANTLIEKLKEYTNSDNPVFISRIPRNYVSSKLYRGVNTLILSFDELKNRYSSSEWGTYQQWKGKGAQVKKGEKSKQVIFWSPITKKTTYTDQSTNEVKEEEVVNFIARTYNVFNKDQVEGLEDPVVEAKEDSALEEEAIKFFKGSVEINTIERGFYFDSTSVHLEPRENFKSSEEYISLLSYLTASAIRKDMKESKAKTASNNAIDELISEIGAGFISGYLGYNYKFSEHNLHQIQGWIKTLGGNKNLVFRACSEAQAVLDRFINSHSNSNDLFDVL